MRTRVIWTAIGMLACGAVLTGANVWAATNTSSALVTCKRVTPCVDNKLTAINLKLNTLSLRVANLRKRNQTLNACLAEFPVTRRDMYDNWYYGTDSNGDGNFDTNNYGGQFTPEMLEQTQSGWGVDIWMVRDLCATGTYNRPVAP